MEPITVLSIISGAAFVYDKWKKSKEAQGSLERFKLPSAAGLNPEIGAAELEMFTSVREGLRHFDRRVSSGLFPDHAPRRSAVPIPSGPITPVSPGARVYRIVPLTPGVQTAAEVAEAAFAEGQTVVASLSLIGLGFGSTDPMLLVVGGPELLLGLCRGMPRGDFAVLDKPVPRVVVEAPPAEVVSEAAPAPKPAKPKAEKSAKPNGAPPNGTKEGEAASAAPDAEAKP